MKYPILVSTLKKTEKGLRVSRERKCPRHLYLMATYVKKLGHPGFKEIKLSNYERQVIDLGILVLSFWGLSRKD